MGLGRQMGVWGGHKGSWGVWGHLRGIWGHRGDTHTVPLWGGGLGKGKCGALRGHVGHNTGGLRGHLGSCHPPY